MKTVMKTVPVFGLCVLLFACSNPASHAPDAQVADPASAPQQAEGISFELSDDSTIEFVGAKVTGTHDGGFKDFSGAITLVDNDPTKSQVELSIDTTSLWSDDDRLTGHLKSADFFDVEQFPTASFISTQITPSGDGFDITGNLDLHGVTKSITFPATIGVGADSVTAQAEFSIKRFDFGIEYPGRADDLIRDEVLIKLNVRGVASAG